MLTVDGFGEPIVIRTAVVVDGDALAVDFAGSSGAVSLGVNVCLNYTRAYTTYGLCAIAPDVPNNEGSFRLIAVTAPEGSILHARYPAAVGGRHLVGHFLPSAVMGALAGVLPDQVMAPGYDGLWDAHLAGEEQGTGRYFSFSWFSSSGTGALGRQDGLSATSYPSGVAGVQVEVMETVAPLIIHRRELRADSGGSGTFRGGLRQTLEFPRRLRRRPRSADAGRRRGRDGRRGLGVRAEARDYGFASSSIVISYAVRTAGKHTFAGTDGRDGVDRVRHSPAGASPTSWFRTSAPCSSAAARAALDPGHTAWS